MSYASDLAFLTMRLQTFLDRPVIDATGLEGSFEWRLSWSARTDIDAPASAFAPALQQQLGLRLERRTAPWDVLVIESVSMPSPN